MLRNTRTEYGVKRLWKREAGVTQVVGFRAQQVSSRGQHRFVGPVRDSQEQADLDARTAAQQHAGVTA